MNLRGGLYYAGAMLKGHAWRRILREIHDVPPDALARRYERETIERAVADVPYYRSLAIPSDAELVSFPILTRRQLRLHASGLQGREAEHRRALRTCSGGSTGEPVWVTLGPTFRDWDYAVGMHAITTLAGMRVSTYLSHRRVLLLHRRGRRWRWRSAVDIAARLLAQCTFLEPYTICSDDVLRKFVARVNRARPVMVWGFAGSLYELARFARKERLRLPRPQFVVSSVETLFPAMRATIEEAFGCPVFDQYGAVEVGRVAMQCRKGKYHLFSFHNRVEVLDAGDRPVGPGGEGRLVITNLHNGAMPLLRYDIGDMACVGVGECTCGSPLPFLESVRGRVNERFVLADGRTVYSGAFVAMFYDHDWVSEFQVLQEDVDRVAVFVRPMPGREIPGPAFGQIEGAVRAVMGSSCRVDWHEVDAIPRTPIGKHLHARSLVWEGLQRETADGAG